jgi:hypothetical protein
MLSKMLARPPSASMHIIGMMAHRAGRPLAAGFTDSVEACVRQLNKADEAAARCAALACMRRALVGAGLSRQLRCVSLFAFRHGFLL